MTAFNAHPLPSEVLRRERLAAQEAVEGVVWHDACSQSVGLRLVAAVRQYTNAAYRVFASADNHRRIGSSDGLAEVGAEEVLEGNGTDAERLDAVAAVVYAFVRLAASDRENVTNGWDRGLERVRYDTPSFIATTNDLLLGARIDWHFAEGHFVQRGSSRLHAEIVKPTATLLDSDPKFVRASRAFQTAINRLSEGKPDVAVTDAASAVQEFFRALGVEGNSLSDQINTAQRKKLMTKYDRLLLKPYTDWLNSDRSEHGNAHAHREGEVSKADAWLAIHVAGALMVRLSGEEPRLPEGAEEHTADEPLEAIKLPTIPELE